MRARRTANTSTFLRRMLKAANSARFVDAEVLGIAWGSWPVWTVGFDGNRAVRNWKHSTGTQSLCPFRTRVSGPMAPAAASAFNPFIVNGPDSWPCESMNQPGSPAEKLESGVRDVILFSDIGCSPF